MVVLVADPLNEKGKSENGFMINYEELLGREDCLKADELNGGSEQQAACARLVIAKMLLNTDSLQMLEKWGCKYLVVCASVEHASSGRVKGEAAGSGKVELI